jgi:positive regulator of sigma E activity
MNTIELTQLFLWSDFWGLVSVFAFLLLGFWAGFRRGKKAAEKEHQQRVILTAIDHLLDERDVRLPSLD